MRLTSPISLCISASILAFAILGRDASGQESPFVVEPLVVALPLAGQSADGEGCFTAAELQDPTAKAYAKHLENRFNTTVTLCLTGSIADSVSLIDEAGVNMIWVDRANSDTLTDTWRVSLVLRTQAGLGRTPFVLFGLKSNTALDLERLTQEQIAYLDHPPASLLLEKAGSILLDYGIEGASVETGVAKKAVDDVFAAVREGDVQAAILDASTWAAACALLDADSVVCEDLQILMYDRPRAEEAFMIPADTSLERHYRLVGVHISLHLEEPELFAWLSQGAGSEYEPAEAAAIKVKSAKTAVAY